MAAIQRKNEETTLPRLSPPIAEIIDPGKTRLGEVMIGAEFPALRPPAPEIIDPGKARLGEVMIGAEFPPKK